MRSYLELLGEVYEKGERREDRTGTGTISYFGPQLRIDLNEGFPLLTTKKMFIRGLKGELLWFLEGNTSNEDLENKYKVRFWKEWQNERGELPNIYGKQWMRWEGPRKLVRVKKQDDSVFSVSGLSKDRDMNYRGLATYGEGLDHLSEGKLEEGREELIKNLWEWMIDVCYDSSIDGYDDFGGEGYKVADEWLDYTQFRKDVEKLPNYHKAKYAPSFYTLSPVYVGSKVFHRDTAVFLTDKEIGLYSGLGNVCEIIKKKDGTYERTLSLYEYANNNGLTVGELVKSSSVRIGTEIVPEGEVYRYQLPVNQLNKLIEAVKNNPESRRMVMSDWNAGEVDDMALHCCHGNILQLYVSGGKLSGKMYQRSADMFLGVPINIASYALLIHMIAQVTGLRVGELIMTFGDAHIYLNHEEQVKTQLGRTPKPLPKLILDPEVKDIRDFMMDSIQIEGYECDSKLTGEVSV